MAKKSMAEQIYTAYLTGSEATFVANGVRYEFNPEGLKSFIDSGGSVLVAWNDVTDKPTTFPPTIGTTATTAKAGNYQPTWAEVSGKPATFPPEIGTTATTAKAGNYQPTWAQVSGKPTTFPPTQGAAVADAVDETDVVTQLNALLASLRASGSIAT